MEAEQQTNSSFWEMLEQLTPKQTSHDGGGAEVIQPSPSVELLPTSAYDRDRALTKVEGLPSTALMEQVVSPANLNRAYARVKAKSPGEAEA